MTVVVSKIIRNHHGAGTPSDYSCLICIGIPANYEKVAVEDFIHVGNIPGKSWLGILKLKRKIISRISFKPYHCIPIYLS